MPNKPFKPKDFGRNKEKLELFARNYGKKAALDQLIDEYNAKMHKKALNEAKTGGKDPEIVHISTNIKTIGRISSEVTKRYITPEQATESTKPLDPNQLFLRKKAATPNSCRNTPENKEEDYFEKYVRQTFSEWKSGFE